MMDVDTSANAKSVNQKVFELAKELWNFHLVRQLLQKSQMIVGSATTQSLC